INAVTPEANEAPAVAITIASIAAAIRRLRPITSATAPVNGAVSAMASVLAVMTALMSAAPTPNSRARSGKSARGAKRVRKLQKPAAATAVLRRSKAISRTALATDSPSETYHAIRRPHLLGGSIPIHDFDLDRGQSGARRRGLRNARDPRQRCAALCPLGA